MTATSRRGRVFSSVETPSRWVLGLCGFALLLLLPGGRAVAQQPPTKQPPVIIGESYDPKAVAAAETRIKDDTALVDAARRGKVYQLAIGEFEVFHPKVDDAGKPVITSPVTWLAINANVARKIEIPAGAEFVFVGKRKGQVEEQLHEFRAEKFTWWVLIGRQQGMTPLVLVQNGADPAKNPPQVVDRFDLTVGKPIPPVDPIDPPPVLDSLAKAAQADIAAGLGTLDDARWYREYMRKAGTSLPGVLTWQTSNQFLDDFDNEIHTRLGKSREPNAKLPSMRRLIWEEFNLTLPRESVSFTDPAVGAANRMRFSEAFVKMADRLKGL